MFNPAQISAALARLPDHAIQKYAAMHKDDPYTMALAVAEFNRRKEMRMPQMQGGEPPKVVDQAIEQMAPPQAQPQAPMQSGIAQLPAGNQQFADGGIVGYAGDEGSYVEGANPLRYIPGVNLLSDEQLAIPGTVLDRLGNALPTPGNISRWVSEHPDNLQAQAAVPVDSTVDAREAQRLAQYPAPKVPPARIPPQGTQGAAPTGIQKLVAGAKASTSGAGAGSSKDAYSVPDEIKKAMQQLEDMKAPEVDTSKREQMLADKEAKLGSMREDNINMALVRAGLAMMASKSSYALQGIGEGAGVGLTQFLSGKKDIQDFQKEIEAGREKVADLQEAGKFKKAEFEQKKVDTKTNWLLQLEKIGQDAIQAKDRNAVYLQSAKIGAASRENVAQSRYAGRSTADLSKLTTEVRRQAESVQRALTTSILPEAQRRALEQELQQHKANLAELTAEQATRSGVSLPTSQYVDPRENEFSVKRTKG